LTLRLGETLALAPPNQDMFDLKPPAPAEIRGEFKPNFVRSVSLCDGSLELSLIDDGTAYVSQLKRDQAHLSLGPQ
jgi:hypothetical protein